MTPERDGGCRVGVVPGVELGGDASLGVPDLRGLPVLASDGDFLVPTHTPGMIGRWNADGSFADTFGRPGEGPGELDGLPSVAVDASDSIHVRDGVGRWSLWDPDGEFARVVPSRRPIPGFWLIAVTPEGHALTANATGDTLIRLDKRTGETRPLLPPLPPDPPPGTSWTVSVDSDGTVWVLSTASRLQRRSPSGEIVFDRVIEVDWLPPAPVGDLPPMQVYPASAVLDIWHDPESDCLWAIARQARSTDPIAFEEMRRADDAADAEIHDYVVACLSPEDGSIVATAVDDGREGRFRGFLRDGRAYKISIDRYGLMTFKFFEVRLVQSPSP